MIGGKEAGTAGAGAGAGAGVEVVDEEVVIIDLFFFLLDFAPEPGACTGNRCACSVSKADLCRLKSSMAARASSILECSPSWISTPSISFTSFFKLGVFPALYFLKPENLAVSRTI